MSHGIIDIIVEASFYTTIHHSIEAVTLDKPVLRIGGVIDSKALMGNSVSGLKLWIYFLGLVISGMFSSKEQKIS